jgi:hypothetical protein
MSVLSRGKKPFIYLLRLLTSLGKGQDRHETEPQQHRYWPDQKGNPPYFTVLLPFIRVAFKALEQGQGRRGSVTGKVRYIRLSMSH